LSPTSSSCVPLFTGFLHVGHSRLSYGRLHPRRCTSTHRAKMPRGTSDALPSSASLPECNAVPVQAEATACHSRAPGARWQAHAATRRCTPQNKKPLHVWVVTVRKCTSSGSGAMTVQTDTPPPGGFSKQRSSIEVAKSICAHHSSWFPQNRERQLKTRPPASSRPIHVCASA